jgi:hypothetical protein
MEVAMSEVQNRGPVNPKRMERMFDECEHQDDLDEFIKDIVQCGGRIISSSVDYENDTGTVVFEVDDPKAFRAAFATTNAADFVT